MIYLDCGFYEGIALKENLEKGIIDDTWTIYAWEINPDIDVKAAQARYPVKIKFYNKAVWTKNGETELYFHGYNNAASIVLKYQHKEPIKVKTMDFSKFVAKLPDDYILCNMDIEGAEFPVLEKMIAEGTIDKINVLDIEFHHRLIQDKTREDSERLITEIRRRGVEVKIKVEL